MYIFYKYQLHPCDIALNLATALIYLQDTPSDVLRELGELGHNAFNVVVYHTYLAHAWNDDVTIKLKDWYNEVGRLYFPSVAAMNDFVWAIFSEGRRFHLFVEERKSRATTAGGSRSNLRASRPVCEEAVLAANDMSNGGAPKGPLPEGGGKLSSPDLLLSQIDSRLRTLVTVIDRIHQELIDGSDAVTADSTASAEDPQVAGKLNDLSE
ncbi:hypothetical protein FOZ62_009352, partial [Perkinsus olseni]